MKGKIMLFLAAIMVSLTLGSYGAMSVDVVGHGGYDDTKLVIDLKNVSFCGNGICNENEYCGSCPEDCGECIVFDIKWPYKYTFDLSEFIEKSPETEIGVIVVPKEKIQSLGVIDWICMFCRVCTWFCDNLLPYLTEQGFKPLAITSEGHIVGMIKAGNVPKIAEIEGVLAVMPDDGIANKLNSLELKISPILKDLNVSESADIDMGIKTGEEMIIPIGGETQIGDVKIRIDKEPFRFLGIIPIPWVESGNFKMKINNKGTEEVSIIKSGSSIKIGNKLIEVTQLEENMMKIRIIHSE